MIQNKTLNPGGTKQKESLAMRDQDADFIVRGALKIMISA